MIEGDALSDAGRCRRRVLRRRAGHTGLVVEEPQVALAHEGQLGQPGRRAGRALDLADGHPGHLHDEGDIAEAGPAVEG